MKLPLDKEGLASIGLNHIERSFDFVPSPLEHERRSAIILDLLGEMFAVADEESRLLFLTDTDFLVLLSNHINALDMRKRVASAGGEVVYGEEGHFWLQPDLQVSAWRARKHSKLKMPRLRRLARTLKFNASQSLPGKARALFSPDALVLGSHSHLLELFLSRRKLATDFTYHHLLVNRSAVGDVRLSKETVELVLDFLAEVARRAAPTVQDFDARSLGLSWVRRLAQYREYYRTVLPQAEDFPAEILVTRPADPQHKLIAYANRSVGNASYAFHHGNAMGGLSRRLDSLNKMAGYTHFVCPTEGSANTMEASYNKHFISAHFPIKFENAGSDHYRTLVQTGRGVPFTPGRKTVMLMGYPMHARRNMEIGWYYFLHVLDAEIRILKALKEAGFEVIYKVHPERRHIIDAFMRDYCDHVVTESFETMWKCADAFIFTYTASTTFGYALCTNRPVLLLALERPQWIDEHYRLLSRRCSIIPATCSDRGRIIVDFDGLLEALEEKHKTSWDFEYVRAFMFPEYDRTGEYY